MTTHPLTPRRVLTPRQMEACIYYAQGLSGAAIAARMYISTATLAVHIHDAKKRMEAETLAQLMFRLGKAARG